VTAEARPAEAGSRRLAQRRRRDRFARWAVTAGGLAVILSILGILFFLVVEVIPLLRRARVEPAAAVAAPAVAPLAVFGDEQRTHAALLGADGTLRVLRLADAAVVVEQPLVAPHASGMPARIVQGAALQGQPGFVLATDDGRAVSVALRFDVEYRPEGSLVTPVVEAPVELEIDPKGAPLRACAASARELGFAVAAACADGSVVVATTSVEENLFTGERTTSVDRRTLRAPVAVERLLLDGRRENLLGATADGQLLWWSLRDPDAVEPVVVFVGSPVTAMSLLIGDQSVVVAQQDGSLSVWSRVPHGGGRPQLTRLRDFPRLDAPVRRLAPSSRDRTFLAQDAGGGLGLYFSTSGRVLWRGASPLPDATAIALSPKTNGALLASAGSVAPLAVESRHPEAGFAAYFGDVWYEGYEQPERIWQSSSGSDEAESKLSLAPLLFGTLKATLYTMLFAVPVALLAAMYTSQFMHWSLRRYVKPAVETMASLPSVVLGFLAGLWLAPRVAQFLLGIPLFLGIAPAAILLAGALGSRLPRSLRRRFPDGSASIAFIAVLGAALALSIALARPIEVGLFGGDFVGWLRGSLGIAYDQKNCVVLGLAMGIAVIPIVFAIAEDAFSNVPRSLVSGSLALGADRWTTVTRVVLPTASPGVFSAIMIGFGRAVGETMIVVMASGNTPIMDWSIFNGLRTLSANIATEIPEAAQGSTLYRTLFLAALLLFAVTFAANTAAELVRQRLRQKYARL
jgi:phosphate transport system permease protein